MVETGVLEVRWSADGWLGRWQQGEARAETVRLFGTAWLPLPFTGEATLCDLLRFYGKRDTTVKQVAA